MVYSNRHTGDPARQPHFASGPGGFSTQPAMLQGQGHCGQATLATQQDYQGPTPLYASGKIHETAPALSKTKTAGRIFLFTCAGLASLGLAYVLLSSSSQHVVADRPLILAEPSEEKRHLKGQGGMLIPNLDLSVANEMISLDQLDVMATTDVVEATAEIPVTGALSTQDPHLVNILQNKGILRGQTAGDPDVLQPKPVSLHPLKPLDAQQTDDNATVEDLLQEIEKDNPWVLGSLIRERFGAQLDAGIGETPPDPFAAADRELSSRVKALSAIVKTQQLAAATGLQVEDSEHGLPADLLAPLSALHKMDLPPFQAVTSIEPSFISPTEPKGRSLERRTEQSAQAPFFMPIDLDKQNPHTAEKMAGTSATESLESPARATLDLAFVSDRAFAIPTVDFSVREPRQIAQTSSSLSARPTPSTDETGLTEASFQPRQMDFDLSFAGHRQLANLRFPEPLVVSAPVTLAAVVNQQISTERLSQELEKYQQALAAPASDQPVEPKRIQQVDLESMDERDQRLGVLDVASLDGVPTSQDFNLQPTGTRNFVPNPRLMLDEDFAQILRGAAVQVAQLNLNGQAAQPVRSDRDALPPVMDEVDAEIDRLNQELAAQAEGRPSPNRSGSNSLRSNGISPEQFALMQRQAASNEPPQDSPFGDAPIAHRPRVPEGLSASVVAKSFAIQLGSVRQEKQAQTLWKQVQKKFPEQLGDMVMLPEKVLIKGKTYFRVQAGPVPNRVTASDLCQDLKQGGQACIVAKR